MNRAVLGAGALLAAGLVAGCSAAGQPSAVQLTASAHTASTCQAQVIRANPNLTPDQVASACGSPSSAPSSSAPAAPTSSDITLSCSSYNDPAGEGALGSGPTAQVTMTTNDFVNASEIAVTVIEFDQDGNQACTDTITLTGPFAAGQTFTGAPESTNGDTYSCDIADVSSDGPVTYINNSPVPGGTS